MGRRGLSTRAATPSLLRVLLVVALVVVIVLTGIPVLMGGMGGAGAVGCSDCALGVVHDVASCLAVVAPGVALLLLGVALTLFLRSRSSGESGLGAWRPPSPPPRSWTLARIAP